MNSSMIWIVVGVVAAIVVLGGLIVVASRTRRHRRQQQAEEIREQARLQAAQLERRRALADETAAKARAAKPRPR